MFITGTLYMYLYDGTMYMCFAMRTIVIIILTSTRTGVEVALFILKVKHLSGS